MYKVVRTGLIFFDNGKKAGFIFKIKNFRNNAKYINSLSGIKEKNKRNFFSRW